MRTGTTKFGVHDKALYSVKCFVGNCHHEEERQQDEEIDSRPWSSIRFHFSKLICSVYVPIFKKKLKFSSFTQLVRSWRVDGIFPGKWITFCMAWTTAPANHQMRNGNGILASQKAAGSRISRKPAIPWNVYGLQPSNYALWAPPLTKTPIRCGCEKLRV